MNLEDEITQGETSGLEFKRVPNEDRSKYLKTVVAFANGRGGRILFGVGDDRTVVGIAKDKVFQEMDAIVDSIAHGCSPLISVDAGIENIGGKSVIAVDVMGGAQCPYFVKSEGERDGVYVRAGATTQRADDATRRELALAAAGRSFDAELCPDAKIDDRRIAALCAKMYRTARKNCRTDAERRATRRITPAQLQSWGIVSRMRGRWVASNAYALLTGDPALGIRLKCGVFKGDTKAVFVDRREFEGSLPDLIDEGFSYILAKINMGCVFKGVFRQDIYELPPDEMRELVVNAFAHRNYIEHHAPVFIAVYDTRVEITSPGGLPRGQTPERALAGYSKIRNVVLAKALHYMHYIEEWGSGLPRVNEGLRERDLSDASVEDAGIAVRINVRRGPKPGIDASNSNEMDGKERAGALNDASNEHVGVSSTPLKERVLAAVGDNPGINRNKLADRTGASPRTLDRVISALVAEHLIEHKGSKKTGGYFTTANAHCVSTC